MSALAFEANVALAATSQACLAEPGYKRRRDELASFYKEALDNVPATQADLRAGPGRLASDPWEVALAAHEDAPEKARWKKELQASFDLFLKIDADVSAGRTHPRDRVDLSMP